MKKRLFGKNSNFRSQVLPLILLSAVCVGAIAVSAIAILNTPKENPGAARGVGGDGFTAYIEDDGDLGMAKVVSRSDVESALGNKSKAVSDADVSKVFNLNGNRGQTVTYAFVRADGVKVSAYVDLMQFKSAEELRASDVTKDTLTAGTINGYPAYYMHAFTIGSDREYRLLVINGLKVYKFVIAQPNKNVKISESAVLDSMKKLALKAKL